MSNAEGTYVFKPHWLYRLNNVGRVLLYAFAYLASLLFRLALLMAAIYVVVYVFSYMLMLEDVLVITGADVPHQLSIIFVLWTAPAIAIFWMLMLPIHGAMTKRVPFGNFPGLPQLRRWAFRLPSPYVAVAPLNRPTEQ